MLKPADSLRYLYIGSAVLLTVSTGILVSILLVLMNLLHPDGYPDPFIPYDSLRPGLAANVLTVFYCAPVDSLETEFRSVCSIQPRNDVFANIEVVKYGGAIERITFFGSRLQTIDLVNHWGQPGSIRQQRRHAVIRWNNGVIAQTVAPIQHVTYQSPIEWVTLTQVSTTADLLFHDVLYMSTWSWRQPISSQL